MKADNIMLKRRKEQQQQNEPVVQSKTQNSQQIKNKLVRPKSSLGSNNGPNAAIN